MKYKKKPIVIDAVLYVGEVDIIREWVASFGQDFDDHFLHQSPLRVKTKEGHSYELKENRDMIIRGVAGEYYPCDVDIFFETYDQV